MATYKIPQDVEAEDKFLGPLTFKQFLFGGGALLSGWLMFYFFSIGWWIPILVVLPFFIVTAAFTIPWSKDQPTDIWLAARIRFMLVPRKRIWDQSGVKDLVQITVPKREEHVYSDGLSQEQVKSRLGALAAVVDSRGWAVKNVLNAKALDDDRLVQPDTTPTDSEVIVSSTTDVMDSQNNPLAQKFDNMIKESANKHRQETLAKLADARKQFSQPDDSLPPPPTNKPKTTTKNAKKEQDFWFLKEADQNKDPNLASFQTSSTIAPGTKAQQKSEPTLDKDEEKKILETIHKTKERQAIEQNRSHKHGHIKTINPISAQGQPANNTTVKSAVHDSSNPVSRPVYQPQSTTQSTSTPPVDPAILSLADNDDLNIATIARQANKKSSDDNEVVIKLH